MQDKEIFDNLRRIVARELGVEEEQVTVESSFSGLGADSLDTAETLMAIEEEFDINIPDSDFEKLATIGDVADYVREAVAQKGKK